LQTLLEALWEWIVLFRAQSLLICMRLWIVSK
jgi:hypothetical protein